MGCKNYCIVLLIILPFCIHCQDGTTLGTAGQSPTVQPTAAVVRDNITKSTTTPKPDTNQTSSPTTLTPGPKNSPTSAVPTSQSSQSSNTSTNSSGTTTKATTDASTLATDEELPTEETVTDQTTATVEDESIPTTTQATTAAAVPAYYELCPSGLPCDMLGAQCFNCSMDASCVYGREYNTTCLPKQGLDCVGSLPVQKTYQCRYCYQTEKWQQSCTPANNCHVYACPKQYIRVNCTVDEDVICLGSRNFHRRKPCNWTSGSKWSTALILSVTLGGFGADRFYLGYWQSGLGKLFSFGGAGVWTLIDVLLIAVGYITPSDGSHYIY